MKKHNCPDHFNESGVGTSDTKIVISGHCGMCQHRMLKIYRYQGTYDKDTMKKLDPRPVEDVFKDFQDRIHPEVEEEA